MAEAVDPAEEAKARVGTALNAKWKIDALLGVGGMGAVYAATHRNGTRGAVKVLHIEFAREGSVRERFLREGKIANRIEHPASVPVFDDDVSDRGEPFLVMELLQGDTFGRVLKRAGKKLPVEDTFRIFEVVLDLLAKCHELSIVHRDIKPANVMITKEGQVKVLDFGIARLRDPQEGMEATRAGTALGTPSFMAPEQAIGVEGVDGRADLFSVGACIYTSLSGVRLNRGRNETESFLLAATTPAPSVARVAPDLPAEIVAFVDKSLAFDRENRFQDAGTMRVEMIGLLAALRAGQLGHAKAKQGGVVVRGNEAIEDDSQLSPEEKAKALDHITGLWKHLGLCMAGFRQYGWGHSQTARTLQAAFDDLVAILALKTHAVRWDVTASSFTYEGKVVWLPDRSPLDRIPYNLFSDGIRRIELKHGISQQELREFLAILQMDRGGPGEDDAVTALWDRRFEHVAYFAIDSFAEGEGDDKAAFQDQCKEVSGKVRALAQIDKDWDEGNVEGRAMQINLAAGLREAGEAASALALDPVTRATLGAQISKGPDEWTERYVDAFAEGYIETERVGDTELLAKALVSWADDQIALRSYSEVFKMMGALASALAAAAADGRSAELAETVSTTMLPVDTLRGVLEQIVAEARGRERDKSAGAPPPIAPEVAAGLARRLAIGDDGGTLFALVLECFDAVRSEELSAVFFDHIKRGVGREPELGALLARANAKPAVELIGYLADRKTSEAMAALEGALKNPKIEVRLEGLARLPEAQADRVRDEVQKIVDDTKPAVRREALELISRIGLVAAGPALVGRIKLPTFHTIELDERREWLHAVSKLNAHRAETLAIELVEEHPILPNASIEQTRMLAAEFLVTASSKEALEATRGAAKKRWWNSEALREVAERSAASIAARLGEASGVAAEGDRS